MLPSPCQTQNVDADQALWSDKNKDIIRLLLSPKDKYLHLHLQPTSVSDSNANRASNPVDFTISASLIPNHQPLQLLTPKFCSRRNANSLSPTYLRPLVLHRTQTQFLPLQRTKEVYVVTEERKMNERK
ncbi:hypothetical protein RchiOBHm_Chr6g0300461 [Rosa chinensis]|uniref:Uncharacterized protein n=1 Tax=Rosa chinensis TaxID=74649 RepID=A0A2P6PYH8_ROSCH|nr:hypothetical protein RchiOBHm_Chr6g0300461 [Rosa chinensis]